MRVLHLLLILTAAALLGCAAAPDSGVRAPRGAYPDAAPPTGVALLRVHETDRGAPLFQNPVAAAWYTDGTLFVCDELAGRVLALDPSSDRWIQFDQPGSRYFQPVDVRLEGFKVLVLDLDGRSLLRYTLGGAYQNKLVNFIHADPSMERVPVAFDVDRDGRSVFCDTVDDQILMFDTAYALEAVVGGHGAHDAQFREPAGVAWLPDGGFIVSDRANSRLCRYTGLGYPNGCTGRSLDSPVPLLTPEGLDADRDGRVYVADSAAGLVHVVGVDGRHLFSFGSEMDPAQTLVAPVDVAVGPDDRIAVCDAGRRAVLVYRLLRR